MSTILPLLSLWLFLGCQPLRWPPSADFQTIARNESGLPNLYFFIKQFHNSKFTNDPFARILRISIERRVKPAPQESEAALECWTIKSVSGKTYRYTLLISITREARFETVLAYEVVSIPG
jgi:hypothetical protein